jgi:hypothetical protein
MPLSKIDSDSLNTGAVTSTALAAGSVASAALASGVPTRAQMPVGSVLQVVSTTTSSNVSSSSGSDVDTGLTVSITPTSSANKIFVLVSSMLRAAQGSSGNCYVYQKVWRGAIGSGTMIHDGYPIIGAQNTDARGVGAVMLVDSPATTASVTYRVSINSAYATSVNINSTTSPSTITLMEIAA